MRLIGILLITVFSLIGCAAGDPYKDKTVSSNSGLVLASFGHRLMDNRKGNAWLAASTMSLYIRETSNPKDEIKLWQAQHSFGNGRFLDLWVGGNIKTDNPESADDRKILAGINLKPGFYEAYATDFTIHGSFSWGSLTRLQRPLKFEVRPNSVTYLGYYHVNLILGENMFGGDVPGNIRTSVRNDEEYDKGIFIQYRPDLKSSPFYNALVK